MRDYLKKLRENKSYSQQNVADVIGTTRQYYNMIENGERQQKMDLPLMQKLSAVFDVPLNYIVDEETKLNQHTA